MLHLYLASLLLSFLLGLKYYLRIPGYARIWVVILGYTIVTEVSVHWFQAWLNAKWVYSAYAIISSLLYMAVYRFLLGPVYKTIWRATFGLMVAFLIFVAWLSRGDGPFPSELVITSSPFLIFLTTVLFSKIIHTDIERKLWARPEFIWNAGFLIYTSINFMHLAFYDYFVRHHITREWSQAVHTVSSILFYLMFGWLFWKAAQRDRAHG